jgi:hypothetical protein
MISGMRPYKPGIAVSESDVLASVAVDPDAETSVSASDPNPGNLPGKDLRGIKVGLDSRGGGVGDRRRGRDAGGGTGRTVVGASVMSDAPDDGEGGESQN